MDKLPSAALVSMAAIAGLLPWLWSMTWATWREPGGLVRLVDVQGKMISQDLPSEAKPPWNLIKDGWEETSGVSQQSGHVIVHVVHPDYLKHYEMFIFAENEEWQVSYILGMIEIFKHLYFV